MYFGLLCNFLGMSSIFDGSQDFSWDMYLSSCQLVESLCFVDLDGSHTTCSSTEAPEACDVTRIIVMKSLIEVYRCNPGISAAVIPSFCIIQVSTAVIPSFCICIRASFSWTTVHRRHTRTYFQVQPKRFRLRLKNVLFHILGFV